MLTMDEYIVVDQILPNYLEVGDLIKVKDEVFEVLNLKDTVDGWDIVVLDNYQETKIISVPEGKLINLTMLEDNI
jgi:HSP90 family molecular chaperone